MSKILSKEEAEKIVKFMLEPLGFVPCVLVYEKSAGADIAYRACNSSTVTRETGFLWWKKTVKEVNLEVAFAGWCWEEVIEKIDSWIKTKGLPRAQLAEKFRSDYARHEADKVLDEELKKST